MKFHRVLVMVVLVVLSGSLVVPGFAQEVDPDTIITADNIDRMKSRTLDGRKLGDMITGPMEMLVREKGLDIGLRNYEEVKLDPLWYEATQKYAGQATLNPETKLVEGWKAGVPFPNVSRGDENLSWKLMYNFFLGSPRGDFQDYPAFTFLFIDGETGIERTQEWNFQRYFMTGRLRSRAPTEGEGNVRHKLLLFGLYPRDISGVGTFTIRYLDGRFDDTWAYLRTVRRTRRLTGGAWMDPIDGTDQLNSDIEVFSAHPTWFKGFKVLGKKWVLGLAHTPFPTWNRGADSIEQRYPVIDPQTKPYWFPDPEVMKFEPRPVWVIETIPPEEHPYSRKVMYLDAERWVFLHGEAYDQKDEFWKMILFSAQKRPTKDGGSALISASGHIIDFKKNHGTIFLHSSLNSFNTSGITGDDISLTQLKQGEPAGR